MVELLKQGQYVPIPVSKQVIIIWAASRGHLDPLKTSSIGKFEEEFLAFCDAKYPDIEHALDKEKKITDAIEAELKKAVEEFKTQFKEIDE